MKRRALALLAAMAMLLTFAPATSAVTEMCVTVYEAGPGLQGDHWTLCDFPNSLHNANLSGDTTGLVNGCQAQFPFIHSDWDNCISAVDYANMPANYKLLMYFGANYTGFVLCLDTNGNYPGVYDMGIGNDQMSSWRILGGNC